MSTYLLALTPSAIGLAVLFVPQQARWIGAARTFAFGAAMVVVLTALLPEAWAHIGPLAAVIAALAYALPLGLAALRRATRQAGSSPQLAFSLGFGALLMHQAFDGLQMGAVTATMGPGVVLAIATHGAPLVAAAVLASARTEGRPRALARGVMLLAATVAGVTLGDALPQASIEPVAPYLRALIAGFLVHVVTHDLSDAPPTDTTTRIADLIAFGAGIALPLMLLATNTSHSHEHAAITLSPLIQAALWLVTVVTVSWWSWPHGVRGAFTRIVQAAPPPG